MYLEGGLPSLRASVHSRMMVSLGIAIQNVRITNQNQLKSLFSLFNESILYICNRGRIEPDSIAWTSHQATILRTYRKI